MDKVALEPRDFDWFTATLAGVIDRARSIPDVERWLDAQPYVQSATLMDSLLKSNPPQREILIDVKLAGGGTARKVVNLFELGPAQFQFHTLRDR